MTGLGQLINVYLWLNSLLKLNVHVQVILGVLRTERKEPEKRQSFQSTCSTILFPFGSTTVISQTAVLKLFVSVGVPYPILCPVGTPKLTQVE